MGIIESVFESEVVAKDFRENISVLSAFWDATIFVSDRSETFEVTAEKTPGVC